MLEHHVPAHILPQQLPPKGNILEFPEAAVSSRPGPGELGILRLFCEDPALS